MFWELSCVVLSEKPKYIVRRFENFSGQSCRRRALLGWGSRSIWLRLRRCRRKCGWKFRCYISIVLWQLAMFPARPPLYYRMMEIIIVSRSLSDLKKSIFQ